MTEDHRSEFTTMQTDVALLKQFNEKVVEPALKNIQESLQKIDYVSQKEFGDYKINEEKKLQTMKSEMRKKSVINNFLAAIAGSVLTMLATYAISDLLGK